MTTVASLKHTPLDELHRELGARMVPFAGYDMPVQYPQGIIKEHLHTRNFAGLFDVSHMGQVVVSGMGASQALEALLPIDLDGLGVNRQCYGLLTTANSGVMDDLIVTRWGPDEFFIVVNAGCKERDIAYLNQKLSGLDIIELQDQALIALQGPAAGSVMELLLGVDGAIPPVFMSGCRTTIDDIDSFVTRSGYTGEDGFEISVAARDAEKLARLLLQFSEVSVIGLGARDSLRLEAGLCLYGHELSLETSPIEAGLTWSIAKTRRAGGSKPGGFPGAEKILQQISQGVGKKRVGLVVEGRAPVREGAELVDADGSVIGLVTSGGFSPTLEKPIAMAYVEVSQSEPGTEFSAMVRGKSRPVRVVKMPFVPQRYQRG